MVTTPVSSFPFASGNDARTRCWFLHRRKRVIGPWPTLVRSPILNLDLNLKSLCVSCCYESILPLILRFLLSISSLISHVLWQCIEISDCCWVNSYWALSQINFISVYSIHPHTILFQTFPILQQGEFNCWTKSKQP